MGICHSNEELTFNSKSITCSICKKEMNKVFDICYSCSVCQQTFHLKCLEKKIPTRNKCYKCGNTDITYFNYSSDNKRHSGSLSFKSTKN